MQFTIKTDIKNKMNPLVVTKDPAAVGVEVQSAYLSMYPDGDTLFLPRVFGWAIDCFTGRYGDYQPIDARYHDFEHTLQGTLCMARLLYGRHLAGAEPEIPARLFQLGMVAILLHDTGYLKHSDDTEGTGAKYTVIHVRRSADFAAELLRQKHFKPAEIQAVQNMILCTGINAELDRIPFQSEAEELVGFALASADLLGQMAADDYVDKLPVLYDEFAEAASQQADRVRAVSMFSSAADLKEKTPLFWEKYVLNKLEHEFRGLYHFLDDPFPGGSNDYVDRIELNMNRLRRELGSAEPVHS